MRWSYKKQTWAKQGYLCTWLRIAPKFCTCGEESQHAQPPCVQPIGPGWTKMFTPESRPHGVDYFVRNINKKGYYNSANIGDLNLINHAAWAAYRDLALHSILSPNTMSLQYFARVQSMAQSDHTQRPSSLPQHSHLTQLRPSCRSSGRFLWSKPWYKENRLVETLSVLLQVQLIPFDHLC